MCVVGRGWHNVFVVKCEHMIYYLLLIFAMQTIALLELKLLLSGAVSS